MAGHEMADSYFNRVGNIIKSVPTDQRKLILATGNEGARIS
jgi:hypothetical protein